MFSFSDARRKRAGGKLPARNTSAGRPVRRRMQGLSGRNIGREHGYVVALLDLQNEAANWVLVLKAILVREADGGHSIREIRLLQGLADSLAVEGLGAAQRVGRDDEGEITLGLIEGGLRAGLGLQALIQILRARILYVLAPAPRRR